MFVKMRTCDLIGPTLDFAVASTLGRPVFLEPDGLYLFEGGEVGLMFRPSQHWGDGGPIIERERIGVWNYMEKDWVASWWKDGTQAFGPTPLVAAMRCFVASRFGSEIEVPKYKE